MYFRTREVLSLKVIKLQWFHLLGLTDRALPSTVFLPTTGRKEKPPLRKGQVISPLGW